MYLTGRGLPQDNAESYIWLYLASQRTNENADDVADKAKNNLNWIEKSMSDEEIETVRLRAKARLAELNRPVSEGI